MVETDFLVVENGVIENKIDSMMSVIDAIATKINAITAENNVMAT